MEGCPKCGGFLESLTFLEITGKSSVNAFDGCKCFNCGIILDPIILKNKQTHGRVANENYKC